MRHRILTILFVILCFIQLPYAFAASDPNDSPGSKDPDLFSRMTGFHIYSYEALEFDRHEFQVEPGKTEKVEGYHTFVVYYANEGITQPSGLQITRNYVNAAKAVGGEEVYAFEDGGTEYSIIRVIKEDKEIWAEVSGANNGMYNVHVLEKQLMKQDVVANADALSGSIKETGRVVVHGIYFDTDKANLKPSSDPALAEIVKMLKADANLRVYVVGHTDNAGPFDHNIKLSRDRAASVVNALVSKHGIAVARLTPFGAGPTSPVASNKNEEGRAKNRRVELVAQ
ncbi:MAG: OmpA family protein [Proteobacteria bacterium]|nr:OmpA family protein [Pseudomonadota bacterium]MBU4471970.1 OmpA family protein [Pseudomonadota bacterium]MCG2753438.1 OmpA family protein [Desulfobacteraceae bacterium]